MIDYTCPFCGDEDVEEVLYPIGRGTRPKGVFDYCLPHVVVVHRHGRECRGVPPNEQPKQGEIEMKPTVGRIVHYYYPNADGSIRRHPDLPPHAAIITDVHGNDVIDLVTFSASGDPCTWGRLHVEHSKKPLTGTWMWPPREEA